MASRMAGAFGGLLVALGLASGAFAQADEPPLGQLGNALKITTTPPEGADFVKQSRKPTGDLQFVPMTGSRPEPAKPVLSLEEIRAKEAELDDVRARHDKLAGHVGPQQAFKSVGRERVVRARPAQPKCLISCAITSTITGSVNSNVAPTTK